MFRFRSLLLTIITFAIVNSIGCGASALEIHAKAAHATRVAMEPVGDEIDRVHKDRAITAAQGATSPTDAEAAVLEVDRQFAPVVDAQHGVAGSVDTWVSSILLAAAEGGGFPVDESLRLANTVLRQWQDLARVAQRLGVDVPPPPGALVTLLSHLAGPGDQSRAPPPLLLARSGRLIAAVHGVSVGASVR